MNNSNLEYLQKRDHEPVVLFQKTNFWYTKFYQRPNKKTAVVFPFFGFLKLHHSSKLDKSDSRFKPRQYTPEAQSKNTDFFILLPMNL